MVPLDEEGCEHCGDQQQPDQGELLLHIQQKRHEGQGLYILHREGILLCDAKRV